MNKATYNTPQNGYNTPQNGYKNTQNASPFIPFPALYVDLVMPGLTDTEWRILCVVIRQTLGWKDAKHEDTKVRKGRDWLSHRQLKERTSKSSDSVSKAVDSLVRSGLIVIEREDGTLLNHASARRRARARLYFKLGILPEASNNDPEASNNDSDLSCNDSDLSNNDSLWAG